MIKSAFPIGVLLCLALPASAKDVVKIGVPAIQTGAMAAYGALYNNGVAAAVKEINASGGLKVAGKSYEVEAVFCDTQAESAKAAACGRRLATRENVATMIMATSIETYPILGFNTTSKPPFLVISSTASGKLGELNNPMVARYWYNTYNFMPELTKNFAAKLRADGKPLPKIGIIVSENEFGKAWSDNFAAGWKAAGGEIVGISTWKLGTTDFYPQLSSLLAAKPDIIAEPDTCPVIGPVLKQARELGFKGNFVIDLSCDPTELEGFVSKDVFHGSYFLSSPWNLDSDATRHFREQYKKITADAPTAISADGYGQLMWVTRAMEKAGTTTDAKAIRAALGPVLDGKWNLLGIKDLKANGDTSARVFMRQILKDSEIVILE